MRIGAGVNLADIGADARRGLDLPQLGVDEDAHADSRAREPLDRLAELRFLRRHVETAFGRDLVAPFGHEHRHLGLQPHRDVDHLGGRRHLEVELDVDELAQPPHVLVLDVPAILAQVNGDAVGAAQMRLDGRPHRIGFVRSARLAQSSRRGRC